MRGELVAVWEESWRSIWDPLSEHSDAPSDLFSELYRGLLPEPLPPLPPPPAERYGPDGELVEPSDIEARNRFEEALQLHAAERARYEEAVNDEVSARLAFHAALGTIADSEKSAISVLKTAFALINESNIENFSNHFFLLVESFFSKFSLRYDLRRPFTIHPTLPGLFSRLMQDLKVATYNDAALNPLMFEFEEAVRELRSGQSAGKIKSCIQKQVNLLEAIGQRCPGVTGNTLGKICEQVGTWPHAKVKDAIKDLYNFACDYPGIRHGGTATNQLRDIDMRDLLSISVVLAGFAPYLTDLIDSNAMYMDI